MPSKSKAQQRLMQAAEHGADFPMAEKVRESMTHSQMHDFAVGSEAEKPEHVTPKRAKHTTASTPHQGMRHFGLEEKSHESGKPGPMPHGMRHGGGY